MSPFMFGKILSDIIHGEAWDWLLGTVLKEQYEKRRQNRAQEGLQSSLVIDSLLNSKLSSKSFQFSYPPESSNIWNECFKKLENSGPNTSARCNRESLQQIFFIYLQLDLESLSKQAGRESPSTRSASKGKPFDPRHDTQLANSLKVLSTSPRAFDFPNSIMKLATGFWALDNDLSKHATASLSNPVIELSQHFVSPLEVRNMIVDGFIANGDAKMALSMQRFHRYDEWDENYDSVHTYLLLRAGQLIEALKYQRTFLDRENYPEILQNFTELCIESNLAKSLDYLNLTAEEEEVLNQNREIESCISSRSVTPSSQPLPSQRHVSFAGNVSSNLYQSQSQGNAPSLSQSGSKTTATRATAASKASTSTPGSRQKVRNRSIQVVQRQPSFNDSPARNTRSAKKRIPNRN